jgi:hypothetical protein
MRDTSADRPAWDGGTHRANAGCVRTRLRGEHPTHGRSSRYPLPHFQAAPSCSEYSRVLGITALSRRSCWMGNVITTSTPSIAAESSWTSRTPMTSASRGSRVPRRLEGHRPARAAKPALDRVHVDDGATSRDELRSPPRPRALRLRPSRAHAPDERPPIRARWASEFRPRGLPVRRAIVHAVEACCATRVGRAQKCPNPHRSSLGCSVHEHRPSDCRPFPFDLTRDDTGAVTLIDQLPPRRLPGRTERLRGPRRTRCDRCSARRRSARTRSTFNLGRAASHPVASREPIGV